MIVQHTMCIPILSKDKIQKLTVRKIQTFKLLSREKGYVFAVQIR